MINSTNKRVLIASAISLFTVFFSGLKLNIQSPCYYFGGFPIAWFRLHNYPKPNIGFLQFLKEFPSYFSIDIALLMFDIFMFYFAICLVNTFIKKIKIIKKDRNH